MNLTTEKPYEEMTMQELEQRRRNLQSMLTCVSSETGDWKIAKCIEYQAIGLDAPYDLDALHTERQAIRDEIAVVDDAIGALEEAAGADEE